MDTPLGEEWKKLETAGETYNPLSFTKDLEEARSRILTIRRKDTEIALVNRSGKPLAGLEVEVVQTHSSFSWGEQLWGMDTLFRHGYEHSARVRHYTQRFTDCLNSANCLSYWTEAPRNDGPKHMEFQGEDHLDEFQMQVDWALKNGLKPKGHPIFWSIDKAFPDWLKRYPMETQWKFIEVRVRNLVARFKGKVKIWDLINEPMWEAAPKNLPHRHWPHLESLDDICEYIIPIMRWAREEDPAACYVINDYSMELDSPTWQIRHKDGAFVTAKSQRDRFTGLFRRLADEGACPDALGMQAHTGSWMDPATQMSILDDFATSGVPLHYTEFWASTGHLEKAGLDLETVAKMKAEYVANIMTIAYSHPAVEAFHFWGEINQAMGFKMDHNSGGLPTSSHAPTPTYWRVRDLIQKEWRTREKLISDTDGRIKFRGFFGDYSLLYKAGPDMPAATIFSIDPKQDGLVRLTLHQK